jgi:hypothetical protein
MRTKEEIWDEALEKFMSGVSLKMRKISSKKPELWAMDEYAKEVAIAFAKWIGENFYYEHLLETWIKTDDNSCQPKTYEELFNQFITSQNQ